MPPLSMGRLALAALGALALLGVVLAAGMGPAGADRSLGRAEPGGAPPPGSGPFETAGFVRVIDGDTLEVNLDGKRAGVGLIGVSAPQGNTPCGREATAELRKLVKGGLRFEEDDGLGFDARTRRLYHAETRNGRLVAEELLRAGVVRADRPEAGGRLQGRLAAAESQARAARQGCVWQDRRAESLVQSPYGALGRALPAPEPSAAAPPAARTPAPLSISPAALATVLPSGFSQDIVAGGMLEPTSLAFLPDGRILIGEKSGIVRVYKDGGLLPTAFLDLRQQVNQYWDRGLLGIAVDPGFASNGYVYLAYVYETNPADYSGPKTARVSRFTASGDTASPTSEVVLLGAGGSRPCRELPVTADCLPADQASHTIGTVRVGPDGSLWVTAGDAASFNVVDDLALRAQDLDSLAGKVLRLTPSGSGLPDNPFWNGSASANRSKVWAYGLRNPYRLHLRPGGGVPYLGDVGWNATEEIDVAPAGANFGWPCYEGVEIQRGYELYDKCGALYGRGSGAVRAPLVAWTHQGRSSAATGGPFYSGTVYPAEYHGAYFYADYAQGFIRYLKVDQANNVLAGPFDFATGADGPVAVEMGPDGHLYYVAIVSGQLRRVRYVVAGTPPASSGYVSDLTWTAMSNAWGPLEKDMSNGGNGSGDGQPITLNGTVYQKGLGAHAPSDVRYYLGGACSTFTADVGVDDAMASSGSVVFQVWADGTRLFESGLLTGDSPAQPLSVPLVGRIELALIVTDGGNGNWFDHADWGSARLTCGPEGDTTPPTVRSTTPAAGATGVAATAAVSAVFSEAMDPASLTRGTVTLLRPGLTSPIAASVAYDPATRTVTLTPSAVLEAGVLHSATIKGGPSGAKDLAGNALAADVTWSFTTAAANTPPTPVITVPGGALFKVGDVIAFAGSATDAQDGALTPAGLSWRVTLYHCAELDCHTHPFITAGGPSGSFTVPDHDDGIYFELTLTATDSAGLSASTSLTLRPQTAQLALDTVPSGLQLVYDGTALATPRTVSTIVGSSHTLYAPSPQGNQRFESWSNGEAQQHTFTAGATNAALSARFRNLSADWVAPVISRLRVSKLSKTSVTITWTTSEPADGQVDYGRTATYGTSTPLVAARAARHTVRINGLTPSTTYYFRARSRDAAGNEAVSAQLRFTTRR